MDPSQPPRSGFWGVWALTPLSLPRTRHPSHAPLHEAPPGHHGHAAGLHVQGELPSLPGALQGWGELGENCWAPKSTPTAPPWGFPSLGSRVTQTSQNEGGIFPSAPKLSPKLSPALGGRNPERSWSSGSTITGGKAELSGWWREKRPRDCSPVEFLSPIFGIFPFLGSPGRDQSVGEMIQSVPSQGRSCWFQELGRAWSCPSPNWLLPAAELGGMGGFLGFLGSREGGIPAKAQTEPRI